MKRGIICQSCGIEAPTKYVEYHQNIGALMVRWSKSVKGNLCKKCLHKHFWSLTGTTAVAGWWGTISFVLTPCFILNNTARYLTSLGMPRVPEGAKVPVVTDEVATRVGPHLDAIFARLGNNENLDDLAREFAPGCGVTPGQVAKFVVFVAQQARQRAENDKPTGGFPVMPPGAPRLPPPAPPAPPVPAIPVE